MPTMQSGKIMQTIILDVGLLGEDGKVIMPPIETGAVQLLIEAHPIIKILIGKDYLLNAFIVNP